MTEIDYNEIVGLRLARSAATPGAPRVDNHGTLRRMTLANAVRIVMEEATVIQRLAAVIERDTGPGYLIDDIRTIYARDDFRRD